MKCCVSVRDHRLGVAWAIRMLLFLPLVSISCDDAGRITAANEGSESSSAFLHKYQPAEVNAGGADYFFWLPPIGTDRGFSGTFDASLSPVIQICAWTGEDCALPLVAEFTSTGEGSERVRAIPEEEHYLVNWHLRQFALDPETDYRVRVMVDAREIGFANIDLVENEAELSEVNSDRFVGIVLRRTLPLKFRIEEIEGFVVGPDGGTVNALDGLVTLVVPQGALSQTTVITADAIPLSALPPDRVLDMGGPTPEPLTGDRDLIDGTIVDIGPDGLTFDEAATITLAYDEVALPPGVTGDDLLVLASEDGATWTMPPGRIHDPTAGTVSASIEGFTFFALDPWHEPAGAVSAGTLFTCSILANGMVDCWGLNTSGQLGAGLTVRQSLPVLIGGGLGFESISAGGAHACGITITGGGASCWGSDFNSQLGTIASESSCGFSSSCSAVPVRVDGGTSFVLVDAGESHTCALDASGQAYCWGLNVANQATNPRDAIVPLPTAVFGAYSGSWDGTTTLADATVESSLWTIETGEAHPRSSTNFAGVDLKGTINAPEGLATLTGFGTLRPNFRLTFEAEFPSGVRWAGTLEPGGAGLLERTLEGTFDLFASDGTLIGTATTKISRRPGTGLRFETLSAGDSVVCGLTEAGEAYCWGGSSTGALGVRGLFGSFGVAVPVSGNNTFAIIDVGSDHACGVTGAGQAYCWGDNRFGKLGTVTTESCFSTPCSSTPVLVSGGPPFRSISAGTAFHSSEGSDGHTCAIATDGRAFCWGANSRGQLGDGTNTDRTEPAPVMQIRLPSGQFVDPTFQSLSAGRFHTCGITDGRSDPELEGERWCWGYNAAWQLGRGDIVESNRPVRVRDPS